MEEKMKKILRANFCDIMQRLCLLIQEDFENPTDVFISSEDRTKCYLENIKYRINSLIEMIEKENHE